MKSFTDIPQSEKLAKILPINSADFHYVRKNRDIMGEPVESEWSYPKYGNPNSKHANYIVQNFSSYEKLPCWSLAALLEILPHEITIWGITYHIKIYPKNSNWFIRYKNNNEEFIGTYSTFLIDACVEMIIKLKEKDLL